MHYQLCTDQDGPGPKPEGNSGSLVYITPVTESARACIYYSS